MAGVWTLLSALSDGPIVRAKAERDFSFLILRILTILILRSLHSVLSVDVHANGCLLLRMTVMLAWSNRCVPLNKLNC